MSDQDTLVIGGRLVKTAESFDVVDPASGDVFARAPRATREHAEQAIRAARDAFPSWAAVPLAERQQAIVRVADALREHAPRLCRMLVREQGKPLAQAKAEAANAETFLRHFASRELPVERIDGDDRHTVEIHHKPLGVVVIIDPWNFPLMTAAYGIALPLLAGNTVVLKPAPTTPLTALAFGRVIMDIFPPGVVNFISDANDLGDYLTSHPDVAKITFTGSIATGRKVMASAAPGLKRLTLELGGNDAAIVLPDVDVAAVAARIFQTAFYNCGQICLTIKRVYVHAGIYSAFCDAIAAQAASAVVSDGFDPATTIGPLQNRMQFEKALRFLEIARRDGKVIAGGTALERAGYFIAPTIVRDISDESELVAEEQFAPILPVVEFTDIDDAVRMANRLPFGLGGSVWSNDTAAARTIALRLEAGSTWVNGHLLWGPHIPMAGAKQSGIGSQFGRDALLQYTQTQVLWVPKDAPA